MKLPAGPRVPFFLQSLQMIANPVAYLDRNASRYGDPFTLHLLGGNSPPVVFLSHPEGIQQIFTSAAGAFELGKITDPFRPLTGSQSLIMQDGAKHQGTRQLLMPPLHGERLQGYGNQICDITAEAIAHWQPGSNLNLRQALSAISLKTILRVVFGMNPGERAHQLELLIEPFLESVNSTLNSVQFFWNPLQQDLGPWSPWGKFLRQQQQIDELIYAEIRDRRGQTDGNDVLSMMMSAQDQAGEAMGEAELRDQLITLLLLGHDTTASALSWAFYWIHQDPQVRSQLVTELDSLGSHPNPMAVAQLPFLQAVCQEALRLYPIALISQPRVVKEAVEIQGYKFAPGTVLVPCIYLAHRRPEVYPEPLEFRPQRFCDRKFSPYEYFPFGGGSRSCIGMALAMYEMKLVLATVLSRYELALCDKGPIRPHRRGITFVPSANFQLMVTQRRSAVLSAAMG
ncbi:cytochrome P450 [Laspinema sp. D1]|uniref:Cytochrome P450 n=1 Tax=Laspinema palackyanum D2a TaxID=2953684 RepID=A0ABT2MXL0_9CYAN|nr:cytochrome P450 [Laspinema sp. D2a]